MFHGTLAAHIYKDREIPIISPAGTKGNGHGRVVLFACRVYCAEGLHFSA